MALPKPRQKPHPPLWVACSQLDTIEMAGRRGMGALGFQFVSADDRAWHAGTSQWRGRERCNDFSIGIELEGCDTRPFEPLQYERLAALVRVLRAHYPIADVVGHSDIAPGRKTDPGPFFEWERLRGIL